MKRLLLYVIIMTIWGQVSAQTFDTMRYRDGRCPRYHYTIWYDTTTCYLTPDRYSPPYFTGGYYDQIFYGYPHWWQAILDAKREYTPRPILLAGVAAMIGDTDMVSDFNVPGMTDTTTTAPDTCYVFYYDSATGATTILGAARWDTATPKIWRLPMNVDTLNGGLYRCCKVYEAMFPTPVPVDSVFWIVGTLNNLATDSSYRYYLHAPKYYFGIAQSKYEQGTVDCIRRSSIGAKCRRTAGDNIDVDTIAAGIALGLYMPILAPPPDLVAISTESADTAAGRTLPVFDSVLRWYYQTIRAIPTPGYEFDHWHDGESVNPRRVQMTQSKHFVAYFTRGEYTITAEVPDKMGTVLGEGTYLGGDTVELIAIPEEGYVFCRWQDGVTDNPRRFIASHDSNFIAHFGCTINAYAPDGNGTVLGAGTYCLGDTVVLQALPDDRYFFSHWHDGSMTNPRRILATGNASFRAYFDKYGTAGIDTPQPALFTLTPNPTTGTVRVEFGDLEGELTLCDATGHEVMRKTLAPAQSSIILDLSKLPSGAYFVTLTTPTATSTQRLVLQ